MYVLPMSEIAKGIPCTWVGRASKGILAVPESKIGYQTNNLMLFVCLLFARANWEEVMRRPETNLESRLLVEVCRWLIEIAWTRARPAIWSIQVNYTPPKRPIQCLASQCKETPHIG